MSNNQMLLQFLIAYINWLYTGATGMPFSRSNGLCGNISRYFGYTMKSAALKSHIRDLFEEAGLNETLPFNDDFHDYEIESDDNRCHKNIYRNLWVLSQIERLEHEHSMPGYPETN